VTGKWNTGWEVLLDPPGPVVAGCFGTWTITVTVGSLGIDEGGTIKFAQGYDSDWQTPQFDRPTEPGLTTAGEEYFTFGREAARLDFMSQQGNDFQVTDE
jgi:hypothetical protein